MRQASKVLLAMTRLARANRVCICAVFFASRRIGELYAVEEQARAGTIAARLALRQREAAPRLRVCEETSRPAPACGRE